MLRAILLGSLLLVVFAPLASAGPDICGATGCPAPSVTVDEDGACAGYGSRYGGAGACLDHDEGVCVIAAGEFWYSRECTPIG